ncbi:MAG: phage virion morphogenesis protein, partial [Phycisphaerae bacterium]
GPVREQMTAAVEENFANATGPQGQAWPARKDPRGTWPLLVKTGTLKAEATRGQAETTDRELTLRVGLVYAATHQYGRAGANIPARPYMGASDRHLDTIGKIIGDAGQKLLDGA